MECENWIGGAGEEYTILQELPGKGWLHFIIDSQLGTPLLLLKLVHLVYARNAEALRKEPMPLNDGKISAIWMLFGSVGCLALDK